MSQRQIRWTQRVKKKRTAKKDPTQKRLEKGKVAHDHMYRGVKKHKEHGTFVKNARPKK